MIGTDNRVGVVVTSLVLVGVLAACGAGPEATPTGPVAEAAAPEVAMPSGAPVVVDAAAGLDLVARGAVLIDVRTPEEFDEAHVEGALLLDVSDPGFDEQVSALDPDVAYVVYCRTGNRSAAATARMARRGIGEVYDAGGLAAWVDAGAPIVD